MSTPDGRHTLVFNGEIYNFLALRRELEAAGIAFRTRGDTEVLLMALAHWGDDALSRLQGMFAFACWDRERRSLLLARDHVGVKPLYIARHGGLVAFASELKALTEHPGIPRDLDLDALSLFLECQYIPAPQTIYRHIAKLPAGTALRIDADIGAERQWSFWHLDFSHKMALSEPEAIDRTEAALRASVASMLVADVPLGAFVSGGVDSSLVAALMTDIAKRPIETFNIGFLDDRGAPDRTQSEHEHAERVAKHLGSHHHTLMVKPADVTDAFAAWVDVFDEPFGDQAALPSMLLSRMARQHVTVALTGEGADELFSGYANYRKRVTEERITGLLGGRFSPLPALLRAMPAAVRRDRIVKAMLQPRNRRYVTIPNVFDRALHPSLLSDAMLRAQRTSLADRAAAFYDECNAASYLEKIMSVDFRLWLPDDLLTKVDRATMAYSLEARVPYLDHTFVEFAATLDPALKQAGRTTKHVLKALARRYLPADVVDRNKQGFVMPLSDWLASGLRPWMEAALGADGLAARGIFRAGALDALRREHADGRRNHAGRIWALTVLDAWFRRYEPDFSL